MGIFDNLWKKHGHRKDKIIQELLAEIKRLDKKSILQEQNERRLIEENREIFSELQRCLHPKPKAFFLTARYQISH